MIRSATLRPPVGTSPSWCGPILRGRAATQLRVGLLAGPVEAILDVLCSPGPECADLRQNTPFAGVLTVAERQRVLAAFRTATRRSNRHGR